MKFFEILNAIQVVFTMSNIRTILIVKNNGTKQSSCINERQLFALSRFSIFIHSFSVLLCGERFNLINLGAWSLGLLIYNAVIFEVLRQIRGLSFQYVTAGNIV